MTRHFHLDGSGEGYCSCGAERCSLPGCDMGCVHKGGWVERDELLRLRRPSARAYLTGVFPPLSAAEIRKILDEAQ